MPTSPALPLPNPAASSTHDHLLLGARVTGRSGQCRSPTTSNTTHAHRPRATRRATTRAQHATHRPWTATAPNTGGGAARSGRTAGRGRGRRAMPAATSTTERHDQPAMAASWPLSRRPPVTIARPAATRQRPPRPSRNRSATGRFCRWDSRRSPQISAGGDPKRCLFTFAFSETLRAPLPQAPRSSQVVQNLR
jgi:hypothetical protein